MIAMQTIELTACDHCGWECEPQELVSGPSGDPICSDCEATFAESSLFAF